MMGLGIGTGLSTGRRGQYGIQSSRRDPETREMRRRGELGSGISRVCSSFSFCSLRFFDIFFFVVFFFLYIFFYFLFFILYFFILLFLQIFLSGTPG